MLRGVALQLARAVAVVFGVVSLTFLLLHLAPGDPTARLLGPAATAEQLEAARHTMGLDRPLAVQYVHWLGQAVRGDFGVSIARGRPVAELLREAWPATALLVTLSLALSYLIGIAIGAWQANARHRLLDSLTSVVTVSLAAMPGYWLGLMLVMVFTYRLELLPSFGARGMDADFLGPGARLVDRLRHLALPLLTLVLIGLGGVARYVRSSLRQLRDAPFMTVARSKGLSRREVIVRHQLRNGMIPVVTLLGLSLPALFSGTVFVEAIFAWPGVGQVLVQAVQGRDYPVVMAATTVSAVLVVLGNVLAEILVGLVDPRSREQHVSR